jgi:threonine/homoserine/homoserine lactone efflux protein
MTVFIVLIVAAALGLAFVAYKHPAAYRVIFIFAVPVLVMGGFLVSTIKIGEVNAAIKLVYSELQHIQKDATSRQLTNEVTTLNAARQFLKVFLIYYISGFAYLVFLMFLPDLINLAKGRHRTLRDTDGM